MRRGPGTSLKAVTREEELIKELREKTALLVYDIPYPPSRADRKRYSAWYSWYDWAAEKLRACGYPFQYSTVIVEESRISEIEKLVQQIEEKRKNLNKAFDFNIPPARISVIRFSIKDEASAKALLEVIRIGLKEVLEALLEDVKKQLEEGRDKTRLQKRIKNFIKRISKQDYLNLLVRDKELRSLILQLEILTA